MVSDSTLCSRRLGVTFHRTFAFNSSAVAKVLAVAARLGSAVDNETLAEETNLGSIYIEAMPRYARGCGLLQHGSYDLTSLGRVVLARDPNLDRRETLWCLHYHLSAPHGPGPSFWHHIITQHFPIGSDVRSSCLIEVIDEFVRHDTGSALGGRSLKGTAAAFLGSYAKSDALGKLGLLTTSCDRTGEYRIQPPEPPSAGVLAYALSDYWGAHYPDRSEVLLEELCDPHGFAGIFFLGQGLLTARLEELQAKQLVTIRRDLPPFVVVRQWTTTVRVAEGVYD